MAIAQILIRLQDNADAGFLRGDVVGVFPEAHQFGRGETGPNFAVVRIKGASPGKLKSYSRPHIERFRRVEDGEEEVTVLAQRRWRIDVDSLPGSVRQKLDSQFLLEVGPDLTWKQLSRYIVDKPTGNTETRSLTEVG